MIKRDPLTLKRDEGFFIFMIIIQHPCGKIKGPMAYLCKNLLKTKKDA